MKHKLTSLCIQLFLLSKLSFINGSIIYIYPENATFENVTETNLTFFDNATDEYELEEEECCFLIKYLGVSISVWLILIIAHFVCFADLINKGESANILKFCKESDGVVHMWKCLTYSIVDNSMANFGVNEFLFISSTLLFIQFIDLTMLSFGFGIIFTYFINLCIFTRDLCGIDGGMFSLICTHVCICLFQMKSIDASKAYESMAFFLIFIMKEFGIQFTKFNKKRRKNHQVSYSCSNETATIEETTACLEREAQVNSNVSSEGITAECPSVERESQVNSNNEFSCKYYFPIIFGGIGSSLIISMHLWQPYISVIYLGIFQGVVLLIICFFSLFWYLCTKAFQHISKNTNNAACH